MKGMERGEAATERTRIGTAGCTRMYTRNGIGTQSGIGMGTWE